MHYFDEISLRPQLYIVEGDPSLLKEFTAYLLVKRTPSLIIDGGNKFDPFILSSFCKQLDMNAMEQVYVSRAFTIFQLKMLITSALPAFIRESAPSVVVVSFFSDLFRSDDVEGEIATILYKKLLFRLKEIVKTYCVPVVVTDHKNTVKIFDSRVSFKMKRNAMVLSIDQQTFQVPFIHPYQKTLDLWRTTHG
ncbi:MAG: hypothetical protein HXS41_08845 [Theionarchaea archaeon]|nr:hypothetical protein [Theionarchaea archaeon]MBU7001567.1 hypothetical protein [Theionarchaea archaeon]MBU7021153.1 hypothetical protein [Theionarchaea archaeon]MBU7033880.1 hypothetical protein [Theionarchaea archaeon]MBU7040588.1 hypothetical protein [Theionarchaea archaeon]